jgi:hypothetical protein
MLHTAGFESVTIADSNSEKQIVRVQRTVVWILLLFLPLFLALIGGASLFYKQLSTIERTLASQTESASLNFDSVNEAVARVENRLADMEKVLAAASPMSRRAAAFRKRLEAQVAEFQKTLERRTAASLQRFEVLAERIEKAPVLNPAVDVTVVAASPPLPLTEGDKAIVRRDLKLEGPASTEPQKFSVGQLAPTPPKPIPEPLVKKLPKLKDLQISFDPKTGTALFVDRGNHIVAVVTRGGGIN